MQTLRSGLLLYEFHLFVNVHIPNPAYRKQGPIKDKNGFKKGA
jgi:hypothetical protein